MNAVRQRLAGEIAGCFGLGSLPRFRGTSASLMALAIAIIVDDALGRTALVALAVGAFGLGFWAATVAMAYAVATGGRQEPERFVIADFAGLLLTLLVAPAIPAGYVLAFGAFRLFVAARPWPIHWYDLGFNRGGGVMMDALLAALGSGAIVLFTAWALGEPL